MGKLVTGIRVIGPGGSHPDLTTSLKRTAARPVDAFPYVIPYLVGAIAVWRSPTRQRLGDRWSGTHVARAGLHLPLETPRPDPWMPGFARIPFGQKAPPFPPPPPMPPPSDPGPMGGAG